MADSRAAIFDVVDGSVVMKRVYYIITDVLLS